MMNAREFYERLISLNVAEDITEYSVAQISKMDERNAKRTSKPSKTAIANEPIKASILEYLEGKTNQTASDVQVALELPSVNKASALLVQMAKEGKLTVTEVKVKGKGKVKGYTLA